MNKKIKLIVFVLLVIGVVIAAVMFFRTVDVSVLNPKGEIAEKQRDLIVFTTLLSSIVVIPVFAMLAIFSWKYRDSNKNATYRPNWDSNKLLESIWWGIPCVIILILALVTWRTSHELDPYKALSSNVKPVTIQVIALQWKWLFIYPEQKVASVNLVQFPKNTPVNFTLTADSPMNSFWIPSLGSQVYAMSGMSAKLHLSANELGDYKGSSANISGKGFADMDFVARASTNEAFEAWIADVKRSPNNLDQAMYDELAKPAVAKEPVYYVLKDPDLYDNIVMKYMLPDKSDHHEPSEGHDRTDMNQMPNMGEM